MNRKETKCVAPAALSLGAAALVLAGSVVGLLISGKGALADAGLAGFANISSASEQSAAPKKKTVLRARKPNPLPNLGAPFQRINFLSPTRRQSCCRTSTTDLYSDCQGRY